MSGKLSKGITESFLAEVWRQQQPVVRYLTTSRGEKVQVVYPGSPTDEAGPDFRQAILATENGELLVGDVEVDLHSSAWWHHGHNQSQRYQQVVLQVVWRHDSRQVALAGGQQIRVLELASLPDNTTPEPRSTQIPSACPAPAGQNMQEISRRLGTASDQRFSLKAARFQKAMESSGPAQALYEGLMESLGYSHNKLPFLRLARALPLRELSVLLAEKQRSLLSVQSLLLGSAGLLPGQSDQKSSVSHPYIEALEKAWPGWKRRQLLSRKDWRFFKVRPSNTPTRRLAAVAYLLAYRWRPDPVKFFLPLLQRPDSLQKSLSVPAGSYWAGHLDFGISAPRVQTLLGAERGKDMVINVVLPLFYAWASLMERRPLRTRALELYQSHPGSAENRLTRLMRERLPGVPIGKSAREQQGLLHLYHNYCRNRRCSYCPLTKIRSQ